MSDFKLPPLSVDERLYRGLLHLYPADFRRRFAREMIEAFRDERRDAVRNGHTVWAFWVSLIPDLFTQAAAERVVSVFPGWRRTDSPSDEDSLMASVPAALRFTEIRHAARRLRRVPTFTAATMFVLALGIGATTAVFSVVNGVLLRPLPYPDPERLVDLSHTLQVAGVGKVQQSDASFLLYQRHTTVFDGVAATRGFDVNIGPIVGSPAQTERVFATGVSASLFGVLRVKPLHGRGFLEGEDRKDHSRVVVLAEGLWRRKFGGDESVVGKQVVIDGESRTVVGIMPQSFQYPGASTELWIPLAFDPAHANAGSFNFEGVARLKPGVSPEAAQAELDRLLPRLLEEFPSNIPPAMWAQAHVRALVTPLRDVIVGDVSRLLWILLGTVGLVLLIACANVANLFLVRGESRQRELAVRSALGAGLAGVLAQYLSEALLLAGGGGAVGVGLAAFAVRFARSLPSGIDLPRLNEVRIDGTVLLFAVALTVIAAIAVSLIPLMRARKIPISSVLKESGRSATTGGERQRARSALVIAQVALALVLVAASGLMARSFARLRDVKPGFDADGMFVMRIALPTSKYASTASIIQFYDRLLEQTRALPGVRSAELTTWVPLTGNHSNSVTQVEDHPLPPNAVPRVHDQAYVTAGYFTMMSAPLLTGRTFGTQDPARPSNEVIVSRAFAERYWPKGNPLGKRIRPGIDGPWFTIVGVASDVHLQALDQPVDDAIYLPMVTPDSDTTSAPSAVAVLIRSSNPDAVAAPVRRVVQSLDPALPVYDEHLMTAIVASASARTRFTMLLLAVASGLALVLGAVGIYGVMAYGVSLRQREIGVRMALGARPVDVRQMISRQGVGLAAIGVVIGLAAALGVTRFLRGLLYDVSPTDPLTLGGTCVVLLAVALLASWIPAQRAAGMDAAEALRSD
jgi:putative ABC transport system permease protein